MDNMYVDARVQWPQPSFPRRLVILGHGFPCLVVFIYSLLHHTPKRFCYWLLFEVPWCDSI